MTLPSSPSERHVTQAKHNADLLGESCFPDSCSSRQVPYLDWNVTVAFYVALHYVQAFLSLNGFKVRFFSHLDRNDYLKNVVSARDSRVNRILPDYLVLYELSRRYRYEPCQYVFPNQRVACAYTKFALQTLPKTLGISQSF